MRAETIDLLQTIAVIVVGGLAWALGAPAWVSISWTLLMLVVLS